MTPIAPHITAFFEHRLPIERGVSDNTRDSYAYTFRLLLKYASDRLKVAPSQLQLEQIDAPLVLDFLDHLQGVRGNGASSRNTRLAAIKSFMHFVDHRVPSALEQVRRIIAIQTKKPSLVWLTISQPKNCNLSWMHRVRQHGMESVIEPCCTCASLGRYESRNSSGCA